MELLLDKGMLICISLVLLGVEKVTPKTVILLLLALSAASLSCYFDGKREIMMISVFCMAVSLILPQFWFYSSLMLYEILRKKLYWAVVPMVLIFIFRSPSFHEYQFYLWLMTMLLSPLLMWKTRRLLQRQQDLIRQRDQSTELNLLLKEKNKSLTEKHYYEVRMAMLQERNRIAREIHDNVGHMLSRSLLQIGALLAVLKEESIRMQLESVRDTLNSAMNSIRDSVHDLHNESIDLEMEIRQAAGLLDGKFQVSLEYDLSKDVPRSLKYALIGIVKEGISNILKHSNGTKASIVLREHPGFYQLSIEDNGTRRSNGQSMGIGLANMADRVESFHGTFRLMTEKGFRIFITIQKQEDLE